METEPPSLSPCHMGEALVAGLIRAAEDLGSLRVHDPARPAAEVLLSDIVDLQQRAHAEPNAPLESPTGSPRFDGQHQVDCALVLKDKVVAMELKLGRTLLSPSLFASRFVAKEVRLTHGDTALAGSMVALLDWNGRAVASGELKLRACGLPVQQQWLLMLREPTWTAWARVADLRKKLGTHQLAGVITLEDLVCLVGKERAREVGLGIAKASIDTWFEELT